MFSNYTDESFEWASEHPCKIAGHKLPKLAPKMGYSNHNTSNKEVEKRAETEHAGHTEIM